jgi:hypothetical protein
VLPFGTSADKKYHAVHVAAAGNTAQKSAVTPDPEGLFNSRMVETSLASDLRHALYQCVADAMKRSDHAWVETCSAQKSIALLMDYIVHQFEHRHPKSTQLPATASFLSASDQYHTFFPPKTCIFTFPKCSDKPISPHWQLSHPEVAVCCFDCKSTTLPHDHTKFLKNCNLFTVWCRTVPS